jgi:hypothetical protein
MSVASAECPDGYRIEQDLDARSGSLSIARWPEVMEAIELIARAPALGQKIPGRSLYCWVLRSTPPAAVYYTVDDSRCVVVVLDIVQL